jgi:hypothetical protein
MDQIILLIFVFPSSIVTISSFAQSDSNSTNQTMKNMNQSANQTVDDHLQQDANQTSGNASDGDVSKITEKAKSVGKNLTEVAKKLAETINKKMNDLAK